MTDSPQITFSPGTLVDDKWIIIEMIGKGAMGEVFRAHQMNLKRDVALKTISREMLHDLEDDPDETDLAFKRFQREVQTMAQVRHPNILTIFDHGSYRPDPIDQSGTQRSIEYIVMEYIPGNTLRYTMSEEGLDDEPDLFADWVKSYFLPLLSGVQAMHRHGIFHRDLKPENIFMDDDIPKIADFGLARSYRLKAVSDSMESKGTLTYMAPEQFSDFRKADQTADIYALGKILFEAFDGKLDNKTLPLKSVRIKEKSALDIPFFKEMDAVISKATAADKTRRFQSVSEMQSALLTALEKSKVPEEKSDGLAGKAGEFVGKNTRTVWIGITIAILAVAGMIAWHLWSRPDPLEPPLTAPAGTGQHLSGINIPENPTDLKKEMIATDGSRLVLTGHITFPDPSEAPSKEYSQLFYMDKKAVSNFLFVEFLNAVKDRISVENGTVKHNGLVLIYLDLSNQPDNIIYRHERFHLINQDIGSRPVTRVTYHGAQAYAAYYGRTLLTAEEFKFAYLFHKDRYLKTHPDTGKQKAPPIFYMHGPIVPRVETPKRIKVLGGMGETVKEWVRTGPLPAKTGSVVAGILSAAAIEEQKDPVLRQQWEGFPDTGFRTKIAIVK